jgi:hypothetical protein
VDDTMRAIFCLCADLLPATHPHDDRPWQRHDADIRTTVCMAACFVRGHHARARTTLTHDGGIPPMGRTSR